MPQHSNCCVPGCINNFRNAPDIQYYRIPKDQGLRKIYKICLKNDTLKLESSATRICSAHFEGGKKLSRTHLPTIFPWTINKPQRRELKRIPIPEASNQATKKHKKETSEVPETVQHEEIIDTTSTTTEQESQTAFTCKDLEFRENNEQQLLTRVSELTKELADLKEKLQVKDLEVTKLKKEVVHLKHELNHPVFDIDKYKDSDEDIAFYTSFPDYKALLLCYELVKESAKNINYNTDNMNFGDRSSRKSGRTRKLSTFQEFIMVMLRLRLGLFERDLAHRFSVHASTVSRITRAWIRFLRCEFEPLIKIPSPAIIRHYMPSTFKAAYPNLAVIVDCTEVEMERPSSIDSQSACYSSYKSRTTAKALIGITPSGVVCFVSEFFPGSTSDKEITTKSGFLSKLKPGYEVLADKGFNCQDELASVGATLIIPAFLKGIEQFSQEQTDHNKKVASLRIHVERFMERIKNWHIFDHKIPVTLTPIASDILIVVSALSNFHPPLIN